MKDWKEFPSEDIGRRAWGIYPRLGVVEVDGFKRYRLKDLKRIPLDVRLSFPARLFAAIDKA